MKKYQDLHTTLHCLDFRANDLPDESVQMVVTSPPYWGLRKYSGEQELVWPEPPSDNLCEHEWVTTPPRRNRKASDIVNLKSKEATVGGNLGLELPDTNTCSLCGAWKGAYGLEPTPEMYVKHTIEILREIRRVLRKDGVVWWNIGDSYAANRSYQVTDTKWRDVGNTKASQVPSGMKPKDLCLIPFRVAIAAQEDGWWVRSVIIWSKPNPMPESVQDRPTESHEYILMLTKSSKYYWDADAVRRGYKQSSIDRADGSKVTTSNPDRPVGFTRTLANGANLRSVWEFPTQPFSDWDYDWSSADYEGSDGKPYKASEDCPLHGQYHDWQKKQKELNDGQPNLDLPRITDIPNYLWSEPQSESVSTPGPDVDQTKLANSNEHIHENTHDHKTSGLDRVESETTGRIEGTQKTPASSSDCSDQESSGIAIENNNQNHKTGLSPETSQPCNSSGETLDHSGDKSDKPSLTELGQHTDESKTSGDSSLGGLFSLIPDHNFDIQRQPLATPDANYKCSCSISQGSHFAVFPEKLPELCIKAATPEVGCCSKCGSPWERVVERHQYPRHETELHDLATDGDGANRGKHSKPTEVKTLGWQPTCKCNAGKVPSTVLDPFAGAGTTLWVAKKLNRKSIGYELSEEYCQLAIERIRQQVML